MLDKIIKLLIKFLVFLLPIFFLPFTYEYFEFNKQYLLWILVPLIIFLILTKAFFKGSIKINKTPLDIPLLILLFITGISSFFGVDPFSSFFGFYGGFSGAFLGLLSLVGLFFIFINYLPNRNDISSFSLIKILLYSYSISLFVCFLSIFSLLDSIFKINSTISLSFNLSGASFGVFSVYASLMFIAVLSYIYFYNNKESRFNIFFFNLISILTFALLIIFNNQVAWFNLFASGILLLVFKKTFKKLGLVYGKIDIKFILPAIIIMVSLFFLLFSGFSLDEKILNRNLPRELSLDYTSTAKISLESIKNHIFLGSGLNTFFYNFSLYRDSDFNTSSIWQFRFDRGGSFILELLGTAGILGFLSFIMVIIVLFYLFYIFFVFINKGKLDIKNKKGVLLVILFILFIQSSLALFLCGLNTLFLFLFFIILSFSMVSFIEIKLPISKEARLILNKDSSKQKMFVIFCFFVTSIFITLLGYEIKFWIADFYAKKGNEVSLLKAIDLNPYRYNYKINLSKLYFNKVKAELIKPFEYQDAEYISVNINNAVNMAEMAVNNRHNSVVTQETLGMIYRDLSYITNGGDANSIKAFKEAILLEPSNPVLYSELGKARLRVGLYYEAEDSFRKSIELKSDYYEAKYGIAKAKIKQGKELEALVLLNELTLVYNDPEIFYEQGRLYYNKKEVNKAINSFSNALKINPNHSNSLYSLGLAYELIGENEKAIELFKRVADLNPLNLEIKNKLIN